MSSPLRSAQRSKAREDLRAVVAMPWGAERNTALRRELDLVSGEIGMISQVGVLQVVTKDEGRAHAIAERISRTFRKDDVLCMRRPDLEYVVMVQL